MLTVGELITTYGSFATPVSTSFAESLLPDGADVRLGSSGRASTSAGRQKKA